MDILILFHSDVFNEQFKQQEKEWFIIFLNLFIYLYLSPAYLKMDGPKPFNKPTWIQTP